MSYGYKLLNLNTAHPEIIGGLITDYMRVKDYATLKRIGLTQSVINSLEDGSKAWYRPWDPDKKADIIMSGEIYPPNDLDIPGDLLKWYWITPDDPRYSTGAATGRRVAKKFTLNPADLKDPLTTVPPRGTPYKTSYINPKLLNFETAPTVNRLLSLWNAYGGDRSVIMTYTSGCGVGRPNFFAQPRADKSLRDELANYPITGSVPFSNMNYNDNFYYTFNMNNAYNGVYSGFNYAEVRQGANPNDQLIHEFGLPEKMQVPRYLKGLRSGLAQERRHYYVRYELTNLYLEDEGLMRSGRISSNPNNGIPIGYDQYLSLSGPLGAIPWIEWPEVWTGTKFNPLKSPIGRYFYEGDREAYIEFMKEVSEHTMAWKEWFDEGCPCDWPDFGGYQDPTVASEQAKQEEINVKAANRYIPTTTTSTTPPLNPKVGDLWRDAATGKVKSFVLVDQVNGTWADV